MTFSQQSETEQSTGSVPSYKPAQLIADRYQVLVNLGVGLTSEVYKVKDLVTGQDVALKISRPKIRHDDELALNREFYHLSRFNHPNIVAVHNFGIDTENRRFFTMEYFEGKPFNEFFANGYTPQLIPAMLQVLQALDAIHCQLLCHCDIKPQNILVAGETGNRGGQPAGVRIKLLDFGFAEKVSLSAHDGGRGTLGYIAPEVLKGTGLDARADIYSLGIVVYEVLTGIGPLSGVDIMQWLRAQYQSRLPKIRLPGSSGSAGAAQSDPASRLRAGEVVMRIAEGTPPAGLETIVEEMIRRNPEERPRYCLDVMERLSGMTGLPIEVAQALEPTSTLLASGFVGRNEHLNRMNELLSEAAAGKGRVVFISGERGIGKSRLMNEFRFLAELRGATIFGFAPASLGARPQSLLESVISYLRNTAGVDLAAGEQALSPVDHARLPSRGFSPDDDQASAERFRLFERCAEEIRRVARQTAEDPNRKPAGGDSEMASCLLMMIDDFELFDPASLEFLRYLVSAVRDDYLMLVVCGLNERRLLELIKSLKDRPAVYHLPLMPLGPDDTRALIASILGPIPQIADLAHWVYDASGGNPLFIVETLYSLIDRKILRLSSNRWTVVMDELRAYRVPDTVSEVIKRRLRGLAPDEFEVLRCGAISGRPLTIEFLRVVLGYEEKQLFNCISRLKMLGLMRPYTGDDISSLILSSKMLESVVIENVSVAERRDSHRRVALALELLYPDNIEELLFDLAHHYTQAGIKDRAFSYNLRAGDRAYDLHLTEQALTYYEAALSVATSALPANERLRLIRRIGELRTILGRYDDAVDIFTQGLGIIVEDKTLQQTSDAMSELLRAIGHVRQLAEKHGEALQYFEQALATLKGRSDQLAVNILLDMGWSQERQGSYARAERLYSQAAQQIDKLSRAPERLGLAPAGDGEISALRARLRYYQGVMEYDRGNLVSALDLVKEAIRLLEKNGPQARDLRSLSHLSIFCATLHYSLGNNQEALQLYERFLPLQRKQRDISHLLRTLSGIGIIRKDNCDWDGAQACFEEALDLSERISDRIEMARALNNLGTIAEVRGEWDKAKELYAWCQRLSVEAGDEQALSFNLYNLALLASHRGELDEAERLLKDALSIASKQGQRTHEEAFLLELVRLELRRERIGVARQYLLRAFRLNLATHDRAQRDELKVVAAEFHIMSGEPAKALTLLAPLINIEPGTGCCGSGLQYLNALYHAGLAYARLGKMTEARQALETMIQKTRSLTMPYETGLGLLALATVRTTVNQPESLLRFKPALALRSLDPKEIEKAVSEIKEAKELFSRLNARLEMQRCDELQERITQLLDSAALKPRQQSEYLRLFYRLSEIVNQGLEQEDFVEQVLDQALEATGAERGVLFLAQGEKLIPAAARGVDHTTLEDAENISRTLLRQVKRKAEPIMTADALNDPRFNTANSVALNKIRSILGVPLILEDRVIGAIYLDSRINTHLFLDDDRDLMMAIANMLAATIDRSLAFRKIQNDIEQYREEILSDAAGEYYLGRSRAIREVYQLVERIAVSDATVLLTGETGTGKTVVARLIHNLSSRKGRPFSTVDCGTLPEQLFESELFGHAKGSFTGAVRDHEGLFEAADGGTLFLDEITNTTLAIQAKLLQAIEERVIRRVGETEMRAVNVRLICATNRDLNEEVRSGRFREDLFYRLNVVRITVPPLRQRTEDIPGLSNFLLRRAARNLNKPILGFDAKAMALLTSYPWPGNVRELANVIERATIMCQKRKIGVDDLGLNFDRNSEAAATQRGSNNSRRNSLSKEELLAVLSETKGNVSETAKRLNKHRRQIQRLIRRYGINRNGF